MNDRMETCVLYIWGLFFQLCGCALIILNDKIYGSIMWLTGLVIVLHARTLNELRIGDSE